MAIVEHRGFMILHFPLGHSSRGTDEVRELWFLDCRTFLARRERTLWFIFWETVSVLV